MFPVLLLSLLSAEPATVAAPALQDPPIRISINNDRRFVRGDRAKVKVRIEDDGYLLVLHADTDGRVRVLFPLDPDDDNFVRGDRTYEIRGRGDREAFTADGPSGEGAVFAAISHDPFRFADYVSNAHWDFGALNERGLPDDPEPELTELARRMSSGRFEYDYLTYRVYRYDDVAYAPTTVYRSGYVDPFCGSSYYFRYDCDPYYYNRSRYSLHISTGSYYDPFYYGAAFYDPFYYGASYYDPFYWTRPYNPYGYYSRPRYVYPSSPYGYSPYSPYRPRYVTPTEFKQTNRTWDGGNYRDRTAGATDIRAVHTVYGEPPARRTVSQGDPGKSPLAPSPSTELSDRPSRRVVERSRTESKGGATLRKDEVIGDRPTYDGRAKTAEPPTMDPAPARRTVERVREPELRRRGLTEVEPESERPRVDRDQARPTYEAPERRSEERRGEVRRTEERRAEPDRAEPARREPVRAEPMRAEPMRAEPMRAEPMRASPPPRSEPSRASSDGGGRRRAD